MSDEDEYFCNYQPEWMDHRTTEEEFAFWLECNNFKLDELLMALYKPEERFNIWGTMPYGRFGLTRIKILDWSKLYPITPWRVTIERDIHDRTYQESIGHWNINFAMADAINRWTRYIQKRYHPAESHQFMIEKRHITFC